MGYYEFPHTRNYDTDLGYLIDWFKTNKNKIEENTAITIEKALSATEDAIKAYNSATSASNSAALALELKNQTEAIKILMQDKIEQIDTNTNRINNLATIDQGSITTTADAELVDIRVGGNRTTYPSAGDAVRGQFSELNSNLYNYTNNVYETLKTENLFHTDDVIVNKMMKLNGDYETVNGGFISGKIKVFENVTYTLNIPILSNTYVNAMFYDINDNKLSYADGFTKVFTAPKNAEYMRINGTIPDIDTTTVFSNGVDYIVVGNNTSLSQIKSSAILKGTFLLDSNFIMPENMSLIGNDCTITCTENYGILLNNKCTIRDIHFVGDYVIPHAENTSKESGLDSMITHDDLPNITNVISLATALIQSQEDKCFNTNISGCTFENIDKVCVYIDSGRHQSKNHMIVNDCYFVGCKVGIYLGGEFNKVSNISIDNCGIGIYLLGGNNNIYGSILKRCDCEIYIKGSGNGLHGEIVSTEVAHSLMCGLYANETPANLGHIVVGCQFADASIEGINMRGFMFTGCRLETWFDFTGSKNSFTSSIFTPAYANLYNKPLWNVPPDTLKALNRNLTGDDSLVN